MFIETQETPNPLTLRFLPVPSRSFVSEGEGMDFSRMEDAVTCPLALELFRLEGVERVFLGRDFISITKSGQHDWQTLKPLALAALVDFLVSGRPIFSQDHVMGATQQRDLDPVSQEIMEILNAKVRPAVARDGGDIVFDRFEEGVVYVQLKGACSGCPSSTLTLKSGIESMLKHYVPEVMEVQETSGF